MKRCSICKKEKSPSKFGKDKSRKDGLDHRCADCKVVYWKKNLESNEGKKTRYKEAQKRWYQSHKQYRQAEERQKQKEYRKTIQGHLGFVWRHMLRRCNNPKDLAYKYYGGRGIKVNFASFIDFRDYITNELQVDPRGLTIDRIDNEGHYECGNIRFVTQAVNNRNR